MESDKHSFEELKMNPFFEIGYFAMVGKDYSKQTGRQNTELS